MKKYKVQIEERYFRTVEIETDGSVEAYKK